ncbi:aminoglycoside phosphotransferase family protein [Nocardia sp. CDC159]|uniref:Aminoglycoside phosphotransferase family protein n=1 Tax=Nocardia pulmonis TaxID=2951408 RepID=A0A9X2E7Y4_9NOCA|nr:MULTISPECIES: phosphotransferase [Nocardia]MCM6775962.1 aminoglycoside phosphotransferase family protein [Nocardia pulmonis]MCM6788062.1 aminoglycoside phosphotransferase family protein [Nocardia sp. CDC159]
MTTEDDLWTALVRAAREAGGRGEPEVLSDREDAVVVRIGEIVVKAHPADTDAAALRARLGLAADPGSGRILLAPIAIGDNLYRIGAGRPITAWPYGRPVDPDEPDAAPWEQAAELLARLHSVTSAPPGDDSGRSNGAASGLRTEDRHPTASGPATEPLPHPRAHIELPVAGGPARVRRALARLRAHASEHRSAAEVVLRAYATLPPLTQAPKTLVHGDFHLGQLIRPSALGEWRLVDVDDLGLGDPVWDLARPAAFFAAGILDPVAWQRFLTAYRSAGGRAVPRDGDVWEALDVPARALVIQAAALAIAKAGPALDEFDLALIDCCRRMTTLTYRG